MWWFAGWALAQEARELELAEALALAASSPAVTRARARADALDGVARQVNAAWLPVASVTGSYARNDHEVVLSFADLFASLPVPPASAPPDATLQPLEALSVAGSLRVPLLAPAAWAEGRAARLGAEAAERSAEELARAVEAGVVSAAAGVEAAEGLLAAAVEAESVAREHLRAAGVAREVGTATAVDVLTAEALVARREGERIQAGRAVGEAREALGALLGLEGPARIRSAALEPSAGGAPERASREAAEAELEAAEARVDAARRRYLPTVGATGSALASTVEYPTGLKTAFRVGLDATFLLADGGARGGRLAQALAEREAAGAALREVELSVAREVREADARVGSAREGLALAERQAALAGEAAQVARDALRAGTGTALASREADAEALRADVGVVAAGARLRTALVEARRARGEGTGW